MNRGMVFEGWDIGPRGVVLALHTAAPPSDEEWSEYLVTCRTMLLERHRDPSAVVGLVITDGGAPSAKQRQSLFDVIHEHGVGTAVRSSIVTTNPLVRGVVTAMSWFRAEARAFAPNRFEDALVHVAVPSTSSREALDRFVALSKRTGNVRALDAVLEAMSR